MATAYTCVTPGATPAVCTPVPVATSGDTINGNDIANGATLVVQVAATPTNVSFVDPGHTLAGTAAATPTTYTVAANTSKAFGHTQLAGYVDPSSNTVGVVYSSATNATAMVIA